MAGRRILTAREQHQMLLPWRFAAPHTPHPDLAESHRLHGSVHTTGGRVLPGWRTAAPASGFSDPAGWAYHQSFAPAASARQGASAYASLLGMPDPHSGQIDYLHAGRTPDSVEAVARNYAAMPSFDPSATKHFDAMRDDVRRQHDFMTNRLGIRTQVVDHDPYPDVHAMLDDVNRNKTLKVMGTAVTGGHPYADNDTNDKFRAVHDFFGHAATGRSFDRHGEQAAYLAHAQMFSPLARPALATETRGQNSSLIYHGGFPEQKVALLHPQFWSGTDAMHLSCVHDRTRPPRDGDQS
jgi:hypothetical protein